MNAGVRIFQPLIVLDGSGVAMVTDVSAEIHAEDQQGLVAGDVLSTIEHYM